MPVLLVHEDVDERLALTVEAFAARVDDLLPERVEETGVDRYARMSIHRSLAGGEKRRTSVLVRADESRCCGAPMTLRAHLLIKN